ncbi:hypothetical protein QQP08_004623, partial [Theobroma cacao]
MTSFTTACMLLYCVKQLLLDNNTSIAKLILPETNLYSLPLNYYIYIALRDLRRVVCSPVMLEYLATHCKRIPKMKLFGFLEETEASLLAANFPLLQHLDTSSCALLVDGLSVILEGHGNLIGLDTRHFYCVASC